MPALITCAEAPLPMETVPAIKIIHFNGSPKADEVYAYARLYAFNGALRFSVTRFEEKPAPSARIGLAIANANSSTDFLFLSIGFSGEGELCLYNNGINIEKYSQIPLQISHGGDEQGLYYTAEGEISAQYFEKALRISLCPKTVLAGNIYSYDTTEAAFGSAFKVPLGISIPTQAGFEAITCVSY